MTANFGSLLSRRTLNVWPAGNASTTTSSTMSLLEPFSPPPPSLYGCFSFARKNMDETTHRMAQLRCMQGGAFPRPPACVAGPRLSRGARAPRVSVAGRVATDGGLLLRGDDVVELLGGIGRGLRRRLAASHQHIGTAGRVAQHQHLRRESAMRVRRRVRGGGAWGGARRSVSAA